MTEKRPSGTSISSPGGSKKGLSRVDTMRSLFEPEDTHDYADQFDPFSSNIDTLHMVYGQRPRFTKVWNDLVRAGVVSTVRHSTHEQSKTRQDDFDPKSTQWAIKTAGEWPYRGHLPIETGVDDWQMLSTPKLIDAAAEVYEASYVQKGKKPITTFITFERQDLHFIQMQIVAGMYIPEACEIVRNSQGEIISALLVCKNSSGKVFDIKIAADEFRATQDGLIPGVAMLANIHDTNAVKKFSDNPSLNQKLLDVFASDLFIRNQDKTVKIKSMNFDGPNIVCGRNGKPIKGDIDKRNTFMHKDLPIIGHEIVVNDDISDPKAISKIISKLMRLRDELKISENYILQKIVQEAINKLKKQDANPELDVEQKNQILSLRGVCELLEFAISLYEPDMQHGSDAISPLLPEDYAVTLLPALHANEKPNRTYGEFDYLKFLFLQENYTQDRIVDFHPCAFVETDINVPEDTSRVNADVITYDSYGKERRYNNFKDEQYSIALLKLIQERNWLTLKLEDPERFKQLAAQTQQTMAIMLKRGKNEYFKSKLTKGIAVRSALLDSVLQMSEQQAESRLKVINSYRNFESENFSPKSPAERKNSNTPQLTRQGSRGLLNTYSTTSTRNVRKNQREHLDRELKGNLELFIKDELQRKSDYRMV